MCEDWHTETLLTTKLELIFSSFGSGKNIQKLSLLVAFECNASFNIQTNFKKRLILLFCGKG